MLMGAASGASSATTREEGSQSAPMEPPVERNRRISVPEQGTETGDPEMAQVT